MVEVGKKDSPAGAGQVGVPSQGKEAPIGVWQPARGSNDSQKKRRPFRAARVVLAAMRLDDSRVGVDPH
jgi:hypothetical protein